MTYQMQSRDPLLDLDTQEILARRSKELIGASLFIVGFALFLALWSFSPLDPNSINGETGERVSNWLGRFGAEISGYLTAGGGYSGRFMAVFLMVWGVRYFMNRGAGRILTGLIFLLPALTLAMLYYATLSTQGLSEWRYDYGLGGVLGDVFLNVLIGKVSVQAAFGFKMLSLFLGLLYVVTALGACGVSRDEFRRFVRFMARSVLFTFDRVMSMISGGAPSAQYSAEGQAPYAQPSMAQASQSQHTAYAQTPYDQMPHVGTSPQYGGGLRLPTAPRSAEQTPDPVDYSQVPIPEPELVVRTLPERPIEDFGDQKDERIKAKIARAMQARKERHQPIAPLPIDPNEGAVQSHAAPEAAPSEGGPFSFIKNAVKSAKARRPEQAAPQAQPMGAPAHEMPSFSAQFTQPQVNLGQMSISGAWPIEAAPTANPVAQPQLQPQPMPAPVEQEPMAPVQSYAQPQPTATVAAPPAAPTAAPVSAAPRSATPMAGHQPVYQRPSYEFPPLDLLMAPDAVQRHQLSPEELQENANMLEKVLEDYGVKGEIVDVRPGPVVTMYELEPAPGLKASRVISLADDIARSMSALSARVSTVPGRSVIGIELPNENREMVAFREMLSSRAFNSGSQKLPLALGKDIGGEPVIEDLAKMPHLLIAGTTGSGKSVAINTMILSLLYKLTPEECRLIMVDPKMLELSVYDGIPHLLSPVVTDPKKAIVALKWVVGEMEERYRKMSKMGVRNIGGYNAKVEAALDKGEMFSRTIQTGFDEDSGDPIFETEEFAPEKMPYIVVIVDEVADLMMVAGKEIEACMQRLAQMARASGIHLIMATQRPSVDVITGTLKSNFPTRISFQVTSKIDSRTILGEMGAEQLLGMGDMLHMAGGGKITRCHGPFVADEEVEEVVNHLKAYGPPKYVDTVLSGPDEEKSADIDAVLGLGGNTNGEDALYDQAVAIVIKDRKCSTSYIQRKLGIGYNKAARLVEQMEDEGLVSPANHVGKRDILVPEQ